MFLLKRAWRFILRARFFFFNAQHKDNSAGAHRQRLWNSSLVLALCAGLTGCARHDSPADITIVNGSEPESLDPAIITGQPEMRIVEGLFEGLMRLDPKTARPIPGLAERYELSPDGRVYTFHLRTNLVWSTGEPIRADDVVYSWHRALNPLTASEYAGQLYYVKNGEAYNTGKLTDPDLVGVHALDDFTVRVELEHPTAFFIDLCAFPTLYVVPRRAIEQFGDGWIKARPLPSCGPFELVAWRLNDKVRVRRNPAYWDAANTQSRIVDFLPITSPTTALNLYEQGRADVVWDKSLVPAELLDVLLQRPDFHHFNYLGTSFIRFNVTRKPFDDPRVRQALGMAVDRDRIVRKILKGGEHVTTSLVPPGTANYASVDGLAYNPTEAARRLAAAGYPGGRGFPRFTFLVSSVKLGGDVAVELQQMWHDTLGIDMEIRPLEWKVYLNAEAHLDYDLSAASWIGDYNDPQTFLGMFTSEDGNNQTGWKWPAYDVLVRAAGEQTDLPARQKTFQQAETILVREQTPIVPLYNYVGVNYYNSNRIQGIYPNVLDDHPLRSIRRVPPAP